MLKIYGNGLSPRSNKVEMCANLLNLEYDLIELNIIKGENRSKEHLARNPAGKIPVINDDGFLLFESNAIMKYLCRKHNNSLYPNELTKQAIVDQWCDFISNHIDCHYTNILFNKFLAPLLGIKTNEDSIKEALGFISRYLAIIEGQLNKTKHIANKEISIADICLLATVDPSEALAVDLSPYPRLNSWRKSLRSQPFYQKVHQSYEQKLKK